MAFLEVKDFYKSFGKTEVLKGVSFEMEKGEVLSIIGSSGGGKTTLLRCLNFLEIVDSGEILLDGAPLIRIRPGEKVKLSDAELRNKRLHFGLVFQAFNLFPQYTALQNVALAPRLLMQEKQKAEEREKQKRRLAARKVERIRLRADLMHRLKNKENPITVWRETGQEMKQFKSTQEEERFGDAVALLERVGLKDKMFNYPCQLSGGQQQRVAIARALALRPDILCFDEPTSALDPELTGEVLRVIRELKSAGTTMIIVTHEMEFARSVSDKVLFVAGGKIEEYGTPDEVFGNPKSDKTRAFLSKMEEKA